MPLPDEDSKLTPWLRFDDWLKYSPDHSTSLVVRGRGNEERGGKYPEPGWMREAYDIGCGLVDPAGAADSLDDFDSRSLSHPSWPEDEVFDFGDTFLNDKTLLQPFAIEFPALGAHKPAADVRQDFAVYHQLRRTEEGNYRHPLDDLLAVEIRLYGDERTDIPAQITVNMDYLKDYLAARGNALLWNLTIERYVSRTSRDAFDVEPHGQTRLRPGITREIVVEDRKEPWARGWVARGTLFLTVAVLPYEKPKEHRNPWSISYLSRKESTVPFVVDAAGTRQPLNEMHPRPMVLYFKRSVLARYLTAPAHSAFFITRRWGRAVNARRQGVDMGLNSQGLITAFTKDVADLPLEEQLHWSAHSASVNGEVCEDWVQTRMMNNPPPVDNVVDLIDEKRQALGDALRTITGEEPFGDGRPSEQRLGAITIGPLTDSLVSFPELAQTLYQLAVEPLKDTVVRKAFPSGSSPPKEGRSLALLEKLLEARCGLSADEAKQLVQPLRTLNWLRVQAAHVGAEALRDVLAELGYDVRPDRAWEAWDRLVDLTAGALESIATRLRDSVAASATVEEP
jgi:hypothetical protein